MGDASDALDAGVVGTARPFEGHKKVLHIGDSTVGYASGLQLEFKSMFPDAGLTYVSHTMTSAGLHSVAEERIVEKMVRRHQPDLVIVQLGTNNLTVPHPEAYLGDVKSLLSQVGNRACYWIGPVSLKVPERGMRAFLRDNVAPCIFYDSYDLTLERQPDGLHPSQKAAIMWSALFFEFAAQHPAVTPATPSPR
jgi:acyl-CoA thioesterase-1